MYTIIVADPAAEVAPVTVVIPPVHPVSTLTITILDVVMREFVNVKVSLVTAASVVVAEVICPVMVLRVIAAPATVPEDVSNPETCLPLNVTPLGASNVMLVVAVIDTVEAASISTVPPLSNLIVDELTVTRRVAAPS